MEMRVMEAGFFPTSPHPAALEMMNLSLHTSEWKPDSCFSLLLMVVELKGCSVPGPKRSASTWLLNTMGPTYTPLPAPSKGLWMIYMSTTPMGWVRVRPTTPRVAAILQEYK